MGTLPQPSATLSRPVASASAILSMASFRSLLDDFRRRLDRDLHAWIAERKAETRAIAPDALALADQVAGLLGSGGKRLRPALVHFGFRAASGDGAEAGELPEALAPLAMSTELLHTYLLIHDDIMDHADSRRGLPSAHAWFRERHRNYGWHRSGGTDSAADYGTAMGILAGDVAQTWAMELFSEATGALEPDRRRGLHRVFFSMCREVIDGQYLEMHLGYRHVEGEGTAEDPAPPSREELLQVLRLKSGLYSVQRPLELGATLAGASRRTLESLGRYGRSLGEAFQLRDDLLGVFGDTREVGKPVGGDLEEGKHTLLIHEALVRAEQDDRRRLRSLLGKRGLDDAEVAQAREILRHCGALGAVEAIIARREEDAQSALEKLDLAQEGRIFLTGLVEYLGQRRA